MLHGVLYAEVSALHNLNVLEVFREHMQFIYKMQKKALDKASTDPKKTKRLEISISSSSRQGRKAGGCNNKNCQS